MTDSVLVALALLTIVPPQFESPRITVDRETHVSRTEAPLKIGETVLAAHLSDPTRLVGAGLVWLTGAGRRAVNVYTSRDGGVSWTKTLSTADTFVDAADEALAFGPDGTVYLVLLAGDRNWGPMDLTVYRSDDGGMAWTLTNRTRTSTSYDRPFLAVGADRTLYVNAIGAMAGPDGTSISGVAMFRSRDRGSSLTFIGIQTFVPPAQQYFNGNVVVTSDGTPVSAVPEINDRKVLDTGNVEWGSYLYPARLVGSIKTMRLTDSFRLEPFVTVAPVRHPLSPGQRSGPMLAIDSTGSQYHDRLYVAWEDGRSGNARILSAFSTDKALTWSTPRTVDDPPDATAPQPAPNNFMPTIAVNRDGVVGAAWYDRRDDRANLGWRVRFAASFDGGETWRPSVPVSSRSNVFDPNGMLSTSVYGQALEIGFDNRQLFAGDTAGFAAAADGSFHAFWIDNRTGVPQVWSARIRVHE